MFSWLLSTFNLFSNLSFFSYTCSNATTRFSNSYTKFNNGGFPHKFYLAWIGHFENFVTLYLSLGYAMHPSSWPKVGGLNLGMLHGMA
jgi:hypothetical protein